MHMTLMGKDASALKKILVPVLLAAALLLGACGHGTKAASTTDPAVGYDGLVFSTTDRDERTHATRLGLRMCVDPAETPESAECIRCGKCVGVCPTGALHVGWKSSAVEK